MNPIGAPHKCVRGLFFFCVFYCNPPTKNV